jgi:hypothetical protein
LVNFYFLGGRKPGVHGHGGRTHQGASTLTAVLLPFKAAHLKIHANFLENFGNVF